MKDYSLSKAQIKELEKLHRSLRDKRQADRVKAVIALARGWTAVQVAEILLIDEKTSGKFSETIDKVQGAAQNAVDKVADAAGNAKEAASGAAETVADKVSGAAETVADKVDPK